MTTFVLVHGTWLGGWVWERVAAGLREDGHTVLTPTLTGLAERRDEVRADTGLATHADDVVQAVRDAAGPVVLVGHSYGGLVAQAAAARLGEQVERVIYLDAFLAERGESAFGLLPWLADAFTPVPDHPELAAPLSFEGLGVLDPDDLAWLTERVTPMPFATHRDPMPEAPSAHPATYVFCRGLPLMADMVVRARARGMDVVEIDTAHMPMVTHPQMLVDVLTAAVAPTPSVP